MNLPRAVLLQLALVLAACSRDAEVQQGEPFVLDDSPIPQVPDSGVPAVPDSGLHAAPLLACTDRPLAGLCTGSNDFPCRLAALVPRVVEECQTEIPCRAMDWLTISTDSSGCFSRIGMTRPDDALIACLSRQLGEVRCPCDAETVTQYLGFGAGACQPDGSTAQTR